MIAANWREWGTLLVMVVSDMCDEFLVGTIYLVFRKPTFNFKIIIKFILSLI